MTKAHEPPAIEATPVHPNLQSLFAAVGELVLTYTGLENAVNRVMVSVLALGEAPPIEPVVASLDASRKLEILKSFALHIHVIPPDWRKRVEKFAEGVERVAKVRNAACHSLLVIENDKSARLVSVSAAKMFRTIGLKRDRTEDLTSIAAIKRAIVLANVSLGDAADLITNFDRVHKSAGSDPSTTASRECQP